MHVLASPAAKKNARAGIVVSWIMKRVNSNLECIMFDSDRVNDEQPTVLFRDLEDLTVGGCLEMA